MDGVADPLPPALPRPPRGDRWRAWRDRLLASPRFRHWAAAFAPTRPLARRRARELFDLSAGFVYSQVLLACVRLRVFDLLADGPQPLDALAARWALPPASARRLLDAAVALRLLERRGADRYGLGALGAPMVGNAAVAAMVEHHAVLYADLADPLALLRAADPLRGDAGASRLRTDEPAGDPTPRVAGSVTPTAAAARPRAGIAAQRAAVAPPRSDAAPLRPSAGTPCVDAGPPPADTALSRYWAYGDALRPADADARRRVEAYTALMTASQPLVAGEVLDAYPLHRHRCLLDVGGGDGAFVVAAAARAPRLQLQLFDLPALVEPARRRFAQAGLGDRASAWGGSFLDGDAALPTGADVVTLLRVVHDHDDDDARRLLRAVHAALPAGGTLLLAEPMAGTAGAEAMGDAYFGLYLLAMRRGRPRRRDELTAMLREAGFATVHERATRQPLQTRLLVARRGR